MKNLVKLSIFAIALGFFASCSDAAKEETPATDAPAATTTTPAPAASTETPAPAAADTTKK